MNFFDDLRNRIEKGVAETGLASKRVVELGKLTFKLKEKKQEAEMIAAKVGWAAFSDWEKDNTISVSVQMDRHLKQLQVLNKEIKELESDLENIRYGNKIQHAYVNSTPQDSSRNETAPLLVYLCPYCAHQVGEDDRQCGNCHKRYY